MQKIYRVTQFDKASIFNLVNQTIADANSGKIAITLADIKGHIVIAANEYPSLYDGIAVHYDAEQLTVTNVKEGSRTMYVVEVFVNLGTVDVPELELEKDLE